MSIAKAILFYSNFVEKSKKMKDVILALNVEMETICVDPKKVRKSLKNNKWGITEVPSLLLLHNNGEHKVLTGDELDAWFSELIDNVKALTEPPPPQTTEITELSLDEPEESGGNGSGKQYKGITTNPTFSGTSARAKKKESEGTPTVVKGIKDEGLSPAELAKQMAEQREQYDEEQEEQRPFGI